MVHTAATIKGMNFKVSDIRQWHVVDNGWSDIGYNYVIEEDGNLEKGRELEYVPAHAGGKFNARSIGICLVGGINENQKAEANYSPQQYITLRRLLEALPVTIPSVKYLCGHRDLSDDADGDGIIEHWEWKKECPCFDAWDWFTSDAMPAGPPHISYEFFTPKLF